jgi:non-specific serine/threonine protein kinase
MDLIAVVMPDGALVLEWRPVQEAIDKSRRLLQEAIYRRFVDGAGSWRLFLGFSDREVPLSPSVDFWRRLAGRFTAGLARTPDIEALRHRVAVPISEAQIAEQLERAPLMTGAEYLTPALLQAWWQSLHDDFAAEIQAHQGSVADFMRTYSPRVHLVGRVFFHMVENKKGDAPFAFLATYSTRIARDGASRHLPLKHALKEYEGRRRELLDLLSTVYQAARESSLVAELVESGDIFHPLAWSAAQAYRFLKDIPVYEAAGILCRIPDWWKKKGQGPALTLTLGEKKPSLLGMDTILNFDMRLSIDGVPLSLAEARALLEETQGLSFIKNRWVAVDPDKLKAAIAAYQKARKMTAREGLSLREALHFQLHPDRLPGLKDAHVPVGVSHGKWLTGVMEKLKHPERVRSVTPGAHFKADLRDYQKKGLNWLYFLHTLGFGACLADDMGLGKTVQVLAFLNRLKADSGRQKKKAPASLLIIPASLLSNWEREIQRFAPKLAVLMLHPSVTGVKNPESEYKKSLDDQDLVITTYTLAARYRWLQDHQWRYVILDEAQAIKNPATRQTRAVKKYRARNRIIMTGTPIENRLSDLWSLFDFVNPGLLGNTTEFKKFAKTLDRDSSGYTRLRRVIGPYVLRRLKTDKTVISDLPDKVEMKSYAALSKKQAVLYRQLVEEIKTVLAEKEGIERKGLILSSLMKFKQLCNHPDQYLGTGGYDEKSSGKFARLREICETIYEKRERVLVFTQFKEITEPLSRFLQSIFEHEGRILHGSIPVARRRKIIDEFQQATYVPFLVLSLKVGGVGLNLTRANHVIHFDRWWNPAVENQATDRAFRIGQEKKVVVHKFVTRGTVEEKIDLMLEKKMKLADDVIPGGGESLITEMSDQEILDLVRFSL